MRTLAIVVPAFGVKQSLNLCVQNLRILWGYWEGANHRKTPVRVCQRQESHTFFGRIKTTKRLVFQLWV